MKRALCLLVLAASYSNEPLPNARTSPYDSPHVAPRRSSGAPVTACAPVAAACEIDADCCSGSFCDNFTYAPRVCTAPQPNGANCLEPAQCASGICQDYQCAAAACSAVGASCQTDTDCCGGSFCDNFTYAPPTCTAPWAAAHYCNEDRQCASGSCVSYQCQ